MKEHRTYHKLAEEARQRRTSSSPIHESAEPPPIIATPSADSSARPESVDTQSFNDAIKKLQETLMQLPTVGVIRF